MADDIQIDDVPEDPTKVTLSREALQNLRGAADRNADREAEAEKLRRENVLLRAGIDLESADEATKQRVSFLVNGWPDGADFTVEAVKAAAANLGLTGEAATTGTGPAITPEEQAQTQERQLLQQGASAAGSMPEVHPSVEAIRDGLKTLANGGTSEDALAVAFHKVVERAHAGTAQQLIISRNGTSGDGMQVPEIAARKGHLDVREVLFAS